MSKKCCSFGWNNINIFVYYIGWKMTNKCNHLSKPSHVFLAYRNLLLNVSSLCETVFQNCRISENWITCMAVNSWWDVSLAGAEIRKNKKGQIWQFLNWSWLPDCVSCISYPLCWLASSTLHWVLCLLFFCNTCYFLLTIFSWYQCLHSVTEPIWFTRRQIFQTILCF